MYKWLSFWSKSNFFCIMLPMNMLFLKFTLTILHLFCAWTRGWITLPASLVQWNVVPLLFSCDISRFQTCFRLSLRKISAILKLFLNLKKIWTPLLFKRGCRLQIFNIRILNFPLLFLLTYFYFKNWSSKCYLY